VITRKCDEDTPSTVIRCDVAVGDANGMPSRRACDNESPSDNLSWGVRTEFDACPGEGRKGNLVEAMLTETRDMAEPRWFFAQALKVALSR